MFAQVLFQIWFKPLPVLLLLASATGYSQQSELYSEGCSQDNFSVTKPNILQKLYLAKTDLLKFKFLHSCQLDKKSRCFKKGVSTVEKSKVKSTSFNLASPPLKVL